MSTKCDFVDTWWSPAEVPFCLISWYWFTIGNKATFYPDGATFDFQYKMAADITKLLLLITLIYLSHKKLVDGDSTFGQQQLSSFLLAPEFKLETRIKIIREKSSGIDEEISLLEYYSNEQQKSKLEFHRTDQEGAYELDAFYYGTNPTNRKQLVKASSTSASPVSCELVDAKKLANQLFGSLSSTEYRLTGEDWLKERVEVPDYVIGMARLLFIAESNKVKLSYRPNEPTIIRNHQTKKYLLELNLGQEKPVTLRVYYSEDGEQDLPLRILLSLPMGAEVMVDFLAVKSLEQRGFSEQADGVDVFTLPLRSGCANKLKPDDLFSNMRFYSPKVFSLDAEITEMSRDNYDEGELGTLGRYFVAYDDNMKVLRTDAKIKTFNGKEELSTSIYVPKRNRKFNVRSSVNEKQKIQEPSSSSIANLILSEPQQQSDCASSKISLDNLMLSPFASSIVPFNKLARMGRAHVRGVEAIVFETVESKQLPAVFFPPVSYHDGEKARLVYDTMCKNNEGPSKYKTVYYFSIQDERESSMLSLGNNQQLGPLLRIDLQKDFDEGLAYRIEVFNFAWTLTSAPNSDRAEDLFSLYEKCSDNMNKAEDQYARVAINLEFKSEISEREDETDSEATLKKVINLLENPQARNLALVRAISMNSNLMPTQIHDFESHLHPLFLNFNPKLFIRVGAKLSNQVYDMYEATKIGKGYIEGSETIVLAKNFEDCYWEAAHMRRQRANLLFSFCFSICTISENPRYEDPSDIDATASAGFFDDDFNVRFDDHSPCELLRMDKKPQDTPADNIISRFWTAFYRGLRGLKLPVLVGKSEWEGEGEEKRLSFLVEQIDVYNNKWSALEREPVFSPVANQRDEKVLKGLALSLQDSATKNVKSRKSLSKVEANHEEGATMNFAMCQSSCLANMTCKSYTVCYYGQEVRCLISNLEFKNPDQISRIENAIKDAKASGRTRGALAVDFEDPKKEEVVGGDTKKVLVPHELWLDNRCRLYNKYALEMFEEGKITFARLRNKYVLAVDGEDHCAELCLKQNINFFKRSAEAKLKYLESQSLSDQSYLNKVLEQQNSDIRSWCSSFRFLNLATSTLHEDVRQSLRPSKLQKNGLCTLVGPKWVKRAGEEETKDATWDKKDSQRPDDKANEKVHLVAMKSYEFLYTMLYERHYGIRLLPKQVSEQDNDYLVDTQLYSNHQIILDYQMVIEACARACFSQTIGLKPWCKSFEYIQDKSTVKAEQKLGGGTKEKIRSYCVFNSISLNDALQMKSPNEFVSSDIEPDRIVWHFELRNTYALDDMIATRLIIGDKLAFYEKSGAPIRLNTLGISIVLLLALVGGIVIGLKVGSRLIKKGVVRSGRRESVENPSRTFLSSLISGISGNSSEVSHKRFEPDLDLPDLSLPSD